MTTDRLFVIMLVILIPMTGCFGGVGDTDAQNPDDNSVPADNSDTSIDIISVGGQTNESTTTSGTYLEPYAFTTDPGQLVEIMHFETTNGHSDYRHQIETNCLGIEENYERMTDYDYIHYTAPKYLFGSHTECTHTVQMYKWSDEYPAYSLVYKIHDTYPITMNL